MAEQYASIQMAAEHFGVAQDFVYDVVAEMNRADRCAFKAGGKWLVDVNDMEGFLIQRTREKQASRGASRRDLSDPSSARLVAARINKSW